MARQGVQVVLSEESVEILRAEAKRTCIPRGRIIDVLLKQPNLQKILDSDESDPGRWLIEWDGRVQSAQAWARELGINGETVRNRLRKGLSTEQVLSPKTKELIEFDGKSKSISEWAKDLGINDATIRCRLRKGLPVEQVLSKEPLSRGRKRKSSDVSRETSTRKEES